MITFLGKEAKPSAWSIRFGPAKPSAWSIRFGPFTRHSPFLYLRQYGFCPDSWPRFRGRHCGTNALRWFCLRQKPKNPPLIPRRGARPRANPVALQHRHALPSGSICCVARACNTYSIAAPSLLASATIWQAVRRFRTTGFTPGPAGPFGNPGGLMGSPETVCVPHKANALCYNTLSFLPERLIRAPVPKPRPRSQAGMSAANTFLTHSPAVPGRSVGAACMRPVDVCPVVTFLGSCTRLPCL